MSLRLPNHQFYASKSKVRHSRMIQTMFSCRSVTGKKGVREFRRMWGTGGLSFCIPCTSFSVFTADEPCIFPDSSISATDLFPRLCFSCSKISTFLDFLALICIICNINNRYTMYSLVLFFSFYYLYPFLHKASLIMYKQFNVYSISLEVVI